MDVKKLVYGFWNPNTYEVFDVDSVEDEDGKLDGLKRDYGGTLLGFNYKKLTADEWHLCMYQCRRRGITPADYIREEYPASGTAMPNRLRYVSIEEAEQYAKQNNNQIEGV